MSSPEHLSQPESHDDDYFTETERTEIELENLRTQADILKPLFFNPNLLSESEARGILRYAELAGLEAQNRFIQELRKHPELRTWNQIQEFISVTLPQLFQEHPFLQPQYGLDAEMVIGYFRDELEVAKLKKELFDEELKAFQTTTDLIHPSQPPVEVSGRDVYGELVAESVYQAKHLSELLQKYNMHKSSPAVLHDDDLSLLPEHTVEKLKYLSAELDEIRVRSSAVYDWNQGLLYQLSSNDLTREYIVSFVSRFAKLPAGEDPMELMTRMKQDLLLKTAGVTKSITSMTTIHNTPIPTTLPGKASILVSYMNTGEVYSSRFTLRVKRNDKAEYW